MFSIKQYYTVTTLVYSSKLVYDSISASLDFKYSICCLLPPLVLVPVLAQAWVLVKARDLVLELVLALVEARVPLMVSWRVLVTLGKVLVLLGLEKAEEGRQ